MGRVVLVPFAPVVYVRITSCWRPVQRVVSNFYLWVFCCVCVLDFCCCGLLLRNTLFYVFLMELVWNVFLTIIHFSRKKIKTSQFLFDSCKKQLIRLLIISFLQFIFFIVLKDLPSRLMLFVKLYISC